MLGCGSRYLRVFGRFDEHDPAGCDDGEESDNIQDPNDIQDYEPSSAIGISVELEHFENELKICGLYLLNE